MNAESTVSSCCFSIMPGVVENILYAISRCPTVFDMLSVKRTPRISGHCASIRCQFPGRQPKRGGKGVKDELPSEYSLAISATASPILFRTELVPSPPSASSNLDLMTYPCSWGRERKVSTVSPLSILRAFDAIRRKMTAAKDRVWIIEVYQQEVKCFALGFLTMGSLEP